MSEGEDEIAATAESGSVPESTRSRPEERKPLGTTMAHRGYTLIGFSFVVFECFFLTLYTDKFWFANDLLWWGIPAVFLAMVVAHLVLSCLESRLALGLLSPIWRGLPPIPYRRWVVINPHSSAEGIGYGLRHVVYGAIDELELTLFGNLCIRTRSLCGPPDGKNNPADLILKVPFGVASTASQKRLIEMIQERRPDVILNQRLAKRLGTADVKGTALIQQLGAVFLFLVLIDVGNSTFSFLEMLKSYYLAQESIKSASATSKTEAEAHLTRAENIRQHPLPFSWVSTKLLQHGSVASGIFQTRSDTLWSLGHRQEAIDSLEQSLLLAKKGFRINLRLARRLTAIGRLKEAQKQIDEAMESHKDSFLPQLYMVASRMESGGKESAFRFYDIYKSKLDEEIFGEEPVWPPNGDRFLHDIWYKDDVEFVFDRVLKGKFK